MQFTNSSNQTTYYEQYGDEGCPVVFLIHGLGADVDMWKPQRDAFVQVGLHVIAVDMLGHGGSSRVKTLELDDFDTQILELMSHLKIEKASFVGVSMGGVIAQHLAVHHPEKIEKLVIVDSFCEIKTIFEKMMAWSQVLAFRFLGKKTLARLMPLAYKNDSIKEYFKEVVLESDLKQLLLAREAINKIDVREKLRKYKGDSLVLVGELNGKVFIKINKKIADALQSELAVVPAALDPSSLVNPEYFNKKALHFLLDGFR